MVRGGLPFLEPVWHDDHWRLWRVVDAADRRWAGSARTPRPDGRRARRHPRRARTDPGAVFQPLVARQAGVRRADRGRLDGGAHRATGPGDPPPRPPTRSARSPIGSPSLDGVRTERAGTVGPVNPALRAYLGGITSPGRRRDAEVLIELMRRATNEDPQLWEASSGSATTTTSTPVAARATPPPPGSRLARRPPSSTSPTEWAPMPACSPARTATGVGAAST